MALDTFPEFDTNELCCIKFCDENYQNEHLTVVKKGIQKLINYSTKINHTALK